MTVSGNAWPLDRETRLHEQATIWSLEADRIVRWLMSSPPPGEPWPNGSPSTIGKTFILPVLGRWERYADIRLDLTDAYKGREHAERVLLEQLREKAL